MSKYVIGQLIDHVIRSYWLHVYHIHSIGEPNRSKCKNGSVFI